MAALSPRRPEVTALATRRPDNGAVVMLTACTYAGSMSNVQIRNVPEDLHRRLKARAAMEGTTVSDLLLHELERFMSRPTKHELLARLASRRSVSTTESSAEAVSAGRQDR